MLIDNLNRCFRSPVVETQLGGTRGGGAVLSAFGHDVIARYRAIEQAAAAKATATKLAALDAAQATRKTAGVRRRPASAHPRHRSPLMPRRARAAT